MIITLTMNPALDVSLSVERLVASHKMRCSDATRDPGGGGINVARAAIRFEEDVTAIFPAGGATGNQLQELLTDEQVPFRAVPVSGDTRENMNALERSTGREFRFVFEGPALSERE